MLLVLCGLKYVGGSVRPGIVIDLKPARDRLLVGRWKPGRWRGRGASSVLGVAWGPQTRDVSLSISMSCLPVVSRPVRGRARQLL